MGRKKKSDDDLWGTIGLIILGAPIFGAFWVWDKYGKDITNAWNWVVDNWIMLTVSIVAVIVLLIMMKIAKKRKVARKQAERERQEEEERLEQERQWEEERLAQERQREEERLERQRQREQMLREKRTSLTEKYGEDIANKIMDGEIWLDQTPEQLEDSWGKPDDKDVKVLKTKTKEIWKFDEIGKNRYRKSVIIENGLVVGWEIK